MSEGFISFWARDVAIFQLGVRTVSDVSDVSGGRVLFPKITVLLRAENDRVETSVE